jgi:DNA polymerase III epsilon subunit family exonuclease
MAPQSQQSINDSSILTHPICAIDFETTGLNKNNTDRAVEIALVRKEPDGSVHAWSSLICSPKSIPIESQRIHNISNAMIRNAPNFVDLYPQIKSFIEGSILIAHHSPFDMSFLEKECTFAHQSIPQNLAIIDTLTMARSFLNLPKNNLSSLSTRVGLIPYNAHRAMNDARNTLFLFVELLQQFHIPDLTINQFQQIITTYSPKGEFRINMQKRVRALVKNPQKVQITYSSSDPARPLFQERVIRPIRIRDQYLQGYCEMRKAQREFRIGRIHKLVELGAESA